MKYQEKLALAKEGVSFLQKGNSVDQFKAELSSRGFYQLDIDKVWRSCRTMLEEKYEQEFKELILNEQIDQRRNDYANLSDEVFKLIKSETIEKIRKEAKQKINQLIDAGQDAEEIIPKVQNSVFSEEDIMKYGAGYYKENVKISGQEKSNYLVIGWMAIGVGIALSIYTMLAPSGGKSILFIGLIVFGVVYLRKANSTRGEIERMDKS